MPSVFTSIVTAFLLLLASSVDGQVHTILKSFGSLEDGSGGRSRTQLVPGPDGTLYGTTSGEFGAVPLGTVFRINSDGTGYTVLKWFTNSPPESVAPDGLFPGPLVVDGTTIYGATGGGGALGSGVVFKMNTDGTGYTILKNLDAPVTGESPSSLMLAGNTLFITMSTGGAPFSTNGTIIKVNTDGSGFRVIKSFTGFEITTPSSPSGGLLLLGNTLYGTTAYGGSAYYGTIFKVNTDGSGYSVLKSLGGATGQYPRSKLIEYGGQLYGATSSAGNLGGGTIFRLGTNGSGYTVLRHLPNSLGPLGNLALSGNTLYGASRGRLDDVSAFTFRLNINGSDFKILHTNTTPQGISLESGVMLHGEQLYGVAGFGGVSDLGTIFRMNRDGSDFKVLKQFTSFAAVTGKTPLASGLVLSAGILYGTTKLGGTANAGTLYRVKADGTGFAVLKQFAGNYSNGEAALPNGGLVQSGNTLYGMTSTGGAENRGTVFTINEDGSGYALIKSFRELDGGIPTDGGLVLGDGVLYGMLGGPNGKVFRLNTDGSGFQILANASNPRATLLLAGDTLYGTTAGGDIDDGAVFKVKTDGSGYVILRTFIYFTDGGISVAGLALSGNTLYGTATYGGDADKGTIFKVNTDGSGFTVLRHFMGFPADGQNPFAALLVSGDKLYGTTSAGGAFEGGVAFQMNTDGSDFTVLKHYSGTDGHGPTGNLVLSGGVLYGTTAGGGELGLGTVFSLTVPGPPSLAITHSGANVILSWPTNVNGLNLQFTTNLASPTTWTTMPTPPASANGQFTVTNSISGNKVFYRLTEKF